MVKMNKIKIDCNSARAGKWRIGILWKRRSFGCCTRAKCASQALSQVQSEKRLVSGGLAFDC
jgi:hypothetical protein